MAVLETFAIPAALQIGGGSRSRNVRSGSVSETRSAAKAENKGGLLKPGLQPDSKTSIRNKRRSRSVAGILQPGVPFAFSTQLVQSDSNNAWKPYTPAQAPVAGKASEEKVTSPLSHASTATSLLGPLSPPSVRQQQQQQQQQQDPEQARLWEEEEERQRLQDEEEAALWAEEIARLDAQTDRILGERRDSRVVRMHGHLGQQAQLVPPSPLSPLSPMSTKPKTPVLDKFAFFTRTRRSNTATLSPTSSVYSSADLGAPVHSRQPSLSPMSPMSFDESPVLGRPFAAEMGIPPSPLAQARAQTRAQTTKIRNSCEMTATVRCRGISMNIAINIDTTTVDVLSLCAMQVPHPIDAATSTVVEVYTQLGLERRLRRYERIRDVMNSWDPDTQNALIVLPEPAPAPAGGNDKNDGKDLELASVPQTETPPKGFVLSLYHSQRPGKWQKRYVTLLEGGQMFSSKKADPNPTDRDVLSLCHLSDYDIYTPTEVQMKKSLKPPKKHCYAIKSQLKTTVTVPASAGSTENLVHFFCTEDAKTAREFHDLVHRWRSWHLANRILQLRKRREADPAPQIVTVKHEPLKSVSHVKVNGHKLKVSVDETPYAIGEFSPLLDLNRFNKPLTEFGDDWELDTSRRSALPPVPALPKDVSQAQGATSEAAAQGAASMSGTAEKAHNTAAEIKGNSAIPSLANTNASTPKTASPRENKENKAPEKPAQPQQTSWFPSAAEHTARQRSESMSRPSTSAGPPSSYEREREQQQRRGHPSPLSIENRPAAPKFVEPSSSQRGAAREGQSQGLSLGRGGNPNRESIVPEALLLIDMITVPPPPSAPPGGGRFLAVPPRNMTRGRNNNNSAGDKDKDKDKDGNGSSSSGKNSPRKGSMPSSPSSSHLPPRPSTSDGRPAPAPRSRSATSGASSGNHHHHQHQQHHHISNRAMMGGLSGKAPPLPNAPLPLSVPPIPAASPLRPGSRDGHRPPRDVALPPPPRPGTSGGGGSGSGGSRPGSRQGGGEGDPRRVREREREREREGRSREHPPVQNTRGGRN